MDLISQIRESASNLSKRIVFPEGLEARTLKAADEIISENIAKPILIGNNSEILAKAKELSLKNIEKATLIDPINYSKKDEYINLLYSLRKHKGVTIDIASKLVENPLYLAALMIKNNDADCEIAGALNATGDVLRPALQIVKTKPGTTVVSGAFLMILKDNPYVPSNLLVFADCAVVPNPTAEELAQIAINTAETTRKIAKIEPRVAMLSFSTKGSAKHEMVDKVIEATEIAKSRCPELIIDGELQADAALVESIAKTKAPGSSVAGNANVFVFPTLEAGNIGYKLVQRLAGAEAVGPVLQGMAAPINDLSRGCSVDDIVNLSAITACM
jgi:phosphate acetyltransferase